MSDLARSRVDAVDGPVGRVRDLRVEPGGWAVCALVVDAGHPVLISPRLLGTPDATGGVVPAALTRAQILSSPHVDTDRAGRSARESIGRPVSALDERIGRVVDVLVDDHVWAIRHLVVALEPSSPERDLAVPVGWVARVDEDAVTLSLPSERVKRAHRVLGTGRPCVGEGTWTAPSGAPPFKLDV